MKAILALEDGRTFEGEAFGHSGTTTGEACFNTSMTGYQEIITDPSYRGQIVTMTYPMIGNYGVNPEDAESSQPHIRGLVIGELSPVASSWRSRQSLPEYFAEHKIIGIEEIDTRALTKHLRSAGAMRACISTELTAAEAVQAAKDSAPMEGSDFVKEVSTETTHLWEGESRAWTIPSPSTGQEGNYIELPEVKYNIVAYDFGIKWDILRHLRQNGFNVTVVNSRTSAEEVLAMKPDGVFLSNGPGDPAALGYIITEVKALLGKTPIFGICLGHQMLALALGAKTVKMEQGHHGANHPVKDYTTNKVEIVSMNHGFAVDQDSLPDTVMETHVSLFDGSNCGIQLKGKHVFSVQHHPEASPGPQDSFYLFERFADAL